MSYLTDYLLGLKPKNREMWERQAKFNAGDIAVVIDTANVTADETTSGWTYKVPFSLRSAAGEVLPFTGNIAAAGAESTAGGGTADPDDATPAMELGRGVVNFVGTAGTWEAADTATLTLTYTTAYAVAKTDTFVVTFA